MREIGAFNLEGPFIYDQASNRNCHLKMVVIHHFSIFICLPTRVRSAWLDFPAEKERQHLSKSCRAKARKALPHNGANFFLKKPSIKSKLGSLLKKFLNPFCFACSLGLLSCLTSPQSYMSTAECQNIASSKELFKVYA